MDDVDMMSPVRQLLRQLTEEGELREIIRAPPTDAPRIEEQGREADTHAARSRSGQLGFFGLEGLVGCGGGDLEPAGELGRRRQIFVASQVFDR